MPKWEVPVYATFRKIVTVEAFDRHDAQSAGEGYGDAYGTVLDEGEWEFYDIDERDEIEAELVD